MHLPHSSHLPHPQQHSLPHSLQGAGSLLDSTIFDTDDASLSSSSLSSSLSSSSSESHLQLAFGFLHLSQKKPLASTMISSSTSASISIESGTGRASEISISSASIRAFCSASIVAALSASNKPFKVSKSSAVKSFSTPLSISSPKACAYTFCIHSEAKRFLIHPQIASASLIVCPSFLVWSSRHSSNGSFSIEIEANLFK